jgi:hypothetical protein
MQIIIFSIAAYLFDILAGTTQHFVQADISAFRQV